ncbi:MAG: SRPBCC family protein [Roseobacter sp.]
MRAITAAFSCGPCFRFRSTPGNRLNTYHWCTDSVDGYDDEVVRRLAQQNRATTVEEGIHLVDSVQCGPQSRGYRPAPLVLDPAMGLNSEHSVQKLQQWMRDAVDT